MTIRWLPLGLLLLLAILLTWWVGDAVADLLVPLYYLYWISRRLVEAIPQAAIWAVFLFVALLLATGSLVRRPATAKIPRRTAPSRQGRIEGWAKLLGQADQEIYYKWQLAQEMQELTLDALAHQERLPVQTLRHRLNRGQLDLPPEIEAYLQASLTSFSHFAGHKRQSSPLNLNPERVVQFLEEKLDHGTE
jgi:hypothetical protein